MKRLLFLCALLPSLLVLSQSENECKKILETPLKFGPLEEFHPDSLISNLAKLKACGLNQLELEFFSQGPILGTIMMQAVSHSKESMTYGHVYDDIMKFKQHPEYSNYIELYGKFKLVMGKMVDRSEWEATDRQLFIETEMPMETLNQLDSLVNQHSGENFTYAELLPRLEIDGQSQNEQNEKAEPYEGIFRNAGNVNYDDLLKEAQQQNKPLLLYFSGYACVNARKIESLVLSDNTILDRLKNDFYFINLYVDDKRSLPSDELSLSDSNGKPIKYVGQKHNELQIEKFKTNTQPYFVIIDNDGNVLKQQGYTLDIVVFLNFLDAE